MAAMKKRPFLLLLLLPLLGMRKCEVQPEPAPAFTLPPATQVGANTLGFVVNGRVWQSYGIRCTFGGGCDTNRVRSYFSKWSCNLDLDAAQTARNVDERFGIYLDSVVKTGTYRSARNRTGAPAYRAQRGMSFTDELTRDTYSSSRPGSATFIITKADTAQHIFSGTFEGILQSSFDSTKSISITNGRFDVKYR
jgi:hypothetical protein